MKRAFLGSLFVASSLFSDVSTVLPYFGTIVYDDGATKSTKDQAEILGVHATSGNLSYLLEFDFSNINTNYKDKNTKNLNQNDISFVYAKYYKNFMFKIGDHYISTNDDQLGNGNVVITSLGGYKWIGYDKYSYGIDGYYSYYHKGHDEDYLVEKPINIIQVTPYFSFYKAINLNWANTIVLKANYQSTIDYVDSEYVSYEMSDTIGYKSFFTTLSAYTGEMKTGVKDGGMTVFNTLDLMKSGYGVKLGYYVTANAVFSLSYAQNSYIEYRLQEDGVNSVAAASFSYIY